MRRLLTVLGLLLALALWWGSFWWGLPWALSLRLEPRTPAGQELHAPDVFSWQIVVTAPFPQLDGLALGDAVQFDRYGVLAPQVGATRCVPEVSRVLITPVGGSLTHEGSLDVERVPAARCAAAHGVRPLLSLAR